MGEEIRAGQPCYRIKRVVELDGADWALGDLVNAEHAIQLQTRGLEMQAAGILIVSEFWIHRETRLPVHTRVRSSASLWWRDPRFPARYVGSHDSKNYENWETTNFVTTCGRILEVNFTPEP